MTLTFGVALFLFLDAACLEGLLSCVSLSRFTVDDVRDKVWVRYLECVVILFLGLSEDSKFKRWEDPVLVGLDLRRRRWLGNGWLALYPASSPLSLDAVSSCSSVLSPTRHDEPLVKISSLHPIPLRDGSLLPYLLHKRRNLSSICVSVNSFRRDRFKWCTTVS
jgi:hypothetical protein